LYRTADVAVGRLAYAQNGGAALIAGVFPARRGVEDTRSDLALFQIEQSSASAARREVAAARWARQTVRVRRRDALLKVAHVVGRAFVKSSGIADVTTQQLSACLAHDAARRPDWAIVPLESAVSEVRPPSRLQAIVAHSDGEVCPLNAVAAEPRVARRLAGLPVSAVCSRRARLRPSVDRRRRAGATDRGVDEGGEECANDPRDGEQETQWGSLAERSSRKLP
jgi:hypothetical protein